MPAPGPVSGSAYVRLEYRRAMEIAVVGAAAYVELAEDGTIGLCRIALAAVAPTIIRAPGAELAITGNLPAPQALAAVAAAASDASRPIGDLRGSEAYRRHTVGVVARRAVDIAARRAGGEAVPIPANRARGIGANHRRCRVTELELNVNGIAYAVAVAPHRSLLSVLRGELGLTGTKEGCDDCECGACMVMLDGRPVNSCSYLAVQAGGREITTVEGLAEDGELHPLQRNILEEGGVQCGFCTPGMLISATALLDANPDPTDDEIRVGLSGNLCRCTGYQKIVTAVRRTAEER